MDKQTHTPAGSLQVNGPLSPPLTPALNGDNNADDIMSGNPFHNTRPVSPDPSVSSASSSNPISSASSSPRRPASAFTATSFTDSQPPRSIPSLHHKDSSPPTYTTQEPEYDHPPTPPPSSHRHSSSQPPPRSSKKPKPRTYTDGRNEAQPFPRLSKPVELLRSTYDVVVIGSGYGGGVAASRMARARDLSVCLLERGREKWPGEYPSGSLDAVGELHCSGVLAPGWTKGKAVEGGDPAGMFHLVMGRGQSAFVANGEF